MAARGASRGLESIREVIDLLDRQVGERIPNGSKGDDIR